MSCFVVKGDIFYCKSLSETVSVKDGFVVCTDGRSAGVFEVLPEKFRSLPEHDYSGKLVLPGLCDLHIHAPQYGFRGTGMDLELLEWLSQYTFPEEIKYSDTDYAYRAYSIFAEDMKKSATTRASVFATVHPEATHILAELLEKSGIYGFVGLVSMDREAPQELCVPAEKSIIELDEWIGENLCYGEHFLPIVTPRFVPCCSNKLMKGLAEVRRKYSLTVQSHLSENPSEIELVRTLCPYAEFYGDVYHKNELFGVDKKGKRFKTVMAHCVYSSDDEIRLMAENGVFMAHCPASNTNLSSGIAPVRRMIENGVKVGLGTDVAGGHSKSIFRAVTDAVQVSKLYSCLVDNTAEPLSFSESFYLATKGGGEFFGKVGSFEESYDFDAVIVDDSCYKSVHEQPVSERVEKFAYLSGENIDLTAKYVQGNRIM